MESRNNGVLSNDRLNYKIKHVPIVVLAVLSFVSSPSSPVTHFLDEYLASKLFLCSTTRLYSRFAIYKYPPTLKNARPQTIQEVTWPEKAAVHVRVAVESIWSNHVLVLAGSCLTEMTRKYISGSCRGASSMP